MAMQIPQNYWLGNQFMMPPLTNQGYRPPPGLIDLTPKVDQSGILATSGVQLPSFVTEGTGRNQGPGEAGLGRGPADIGYTKGEATADTTTTATDSWRDFAKAGLIGAIPGITAASYALFGKTPLEAIRDQIAGAISGGDMSGAIGQNPGGLTNPGVDLVGQANDPFGGGTGLGQGSDGLGVGADPSQAGNTGDAASESPGLYAKGGRVNRRDLMGPDPPGPDQGMGGLMGGEFVVNARAAKKHRGILDAINAGASKAKLRGLLG